MLMIKWIEDFVKVDLTFLKAFFSSLPINPIGHNVNIILLPSLSNTFVLSI
ncbi:MAG: hypothetical protein V1825_02140 [Candidatus Falkowbacteria bacterium]